MFKFKKILPRTLFTRSLIILVTPLVLVQLITTFMFFDNHWGRTTTRLAYSIAGEIALVADAVDENSSAASVQKWIDDARKNLELRIDFKRGEKLSEDDVRVGSRLWEFAIASKLKKELHQSVARPFHLRVDLAEKWVYVDVQLEDGVLNVVFPQRRIFSSSGYIVLLWMFGSSILLLIIAILFMRNQIKPIRRLAIAAERFGKGGDLVSFKPTGAKEVRQAAAAFIEMHRRIKRQIEQRTAMLAGVSHDLRTPLTRLKLSLEMMGKGKDIEAMKADIHDMERMITGYLDFARGADGEQASFTNLSDLVRKACSMASKTIYDDVQGDVYLMLKPLAMERCLVNIVKNAERYGDHVWVRMVKGEEFYEIVVEDDGPGIPENKLAEVFKPFYRIDEARDTEEGHVGLGLSIALDIVQAHGGDIELSKSEKGGLAVRLLLPV